MEGKLGQLWSTDQRERARRFTLRGQDTSDRAAPHRDPAKGGGGGVWR